MFQSKRARRSAQLLRRCESHDTSHCVLKSGPGLPLSSRFSARLPRRATPVVRYDMIWKHAPLPSLAPHSWDLVASRARCVCVCQAGDSSQRRGRPDAARPVPEALRSLVCPGLRRALISILSGPVPRVLPRGRRRRAPGDFPLKGVANRNAQRLSVKGRVWQLASLHISNGATQLRSSSEKRPSVTLSPLVPWGNGPR